MDRLNSITKQFGLELSDKQIEQFSKYYDILVEWNKVMNLTAITEKEDVIIKHFADSLLLSKYKDLHENIDVIDVGTGAGFPGIPLKIAFPELNITLMDSLNKRLKFLDEVIDELGLQDIHTVHSRAEDGGRNNDLRELERVVMLKVVDQKWMYPGQLPILQLCRNGVFHLSSRVDILYLISQMLCRKRCGMERKQSGFLGDRSKTYLIRIYRRPITREALCL